MAEDQHGIFLSYSSRDLPEVEILDRELRRRGVPLWRDRRELAAGRVTEEEIAEAASGAAGFAFYLTRAAAESDWVREKEREAALANRDRNRGVGIVPIFRDPPGEVTDRMKALAGDPVAAGREPSPYDLGRFNGYVFEPGKEPRGQITRAAEAVLECHLRSVVGRLGAGERLRIGAATRGGPGLRAVEPHLLLDWTRDYPDPNHPVGPATVEPDRLDGELLPALASTWRQVRRLWPSLRFDVYPKCHLSMALALGFQLHRNTGADLRVFQVGADGAGRFWRGPARVEQPQPEGWRSSIVEIGGSGQGLAVVIGVSQRLIPADPERREKRPEDPELRRLDLPVALYLEPAQAEPGKTCFDDLDSLEAHRLAAAAAEMASPERKDRGLDAIHLFAAVPAPFAVLLGQQLASVGLVQTYEWLDSSDGYRLACQLRTS